MIGNKYFAILFFIYLKLKLEVMDGRIFKGFFLFQMEIILVIQLDTKQEKFGQV